MHWRVIALNSHSAMFSQLPCLGLCRIPSVRGQLLQSAADWNVAVVKLRQAMGQLVRE